MAKRFMYLSIGLLALATAYHLGGARTEGVLPRCCTRLLAPVCAFIVLLVCTPDLGPPGLALRS